MRRTKHSIYPENKQTHSFPIFPCCEVIFTLSEMMPEQIIIVIRFGFHQQRLSFHCFLLIIYGFFVVEMMENKLMPFQVFHFSPWEIVATNK